ncbi:MAG: hypothetical protein LAN62_14000 [Acidobacteriia bacterium]|nr:hypothetical protein [Terriglobia bacterium]
MAELRLNPVTRRWIVTGKRAVMPDVLEVDGLCPFCPGNERLTPKAIEELRDASGAWMTRVFHDRAPIFQVEAPLNPRAEGLYDHMNTLGAHEVVVDTPQHGISMGALPEEQMARVIEVCRDRILDLKQDRRFRYVSLFKDQRDITPPWLTHSLSQILASPVLREEGTLPVLRHGGAGSAAGQARRGPEPGLHRVVPLRVALPV